MVKRPLPDSEEARRRKRENCLSRPIRIGVVPTLLLLPAAAGLYMLL